MTIGKRLKKLRLENGLSQKFLAEYLDISQSVYSRYERGVINPPEQKLRALSELYDVSMDFITGLSPIREKNNIAAVSSLYVLDRYSELPPEAKTQLVDYLDFLYSKYYAPDDAEDE